MTDKFINSPYKKIPVELLQKYTMNNRIPILNMWRDDSRKSDVKWSNNFINSFIERLSPENINSNKEGHTSYGHRTCHSLLKSLEKYNIRNKKVAVIGSVSPWLEAILINLGNDVTTIEYNVPAANYNNLTCKNYFDYFEKNENMYDSVVTFSSIEHSGLGRYGDPLDPNGDIKTMRHIHKNLKENGLLIWGAPVGRDAVVWNCHRIYGKLRLPLMFENFEELEWEGNMKNKLLNAPLKNGSFQPVVVLRKKSKDNFSKNLDKPGTPLSFENEVIKREYLLGYKGTPKRNLITFKK